MNSKKAKTSERLPDGPFGAAWRTLAVQRIKLAETLRHRRLRGVFRVPTSAMASPVQSQKTCI